MFTSWEQCFTWCCTIVEGQYTDRLAKTTLRYSNASPFSFWIFIFVVIVLPNQLYVYSEHTMGEIVVQQTFKLRVKYVSYFELGFRKSKNVCPAQCSFLDHTCSRRGRQSIIDSIFRWAGAGFVVLEKKKAVVNGRWGLVNAQKRLSQHGSGKTLVPLSKFFCWLIKCPVSFLRWSRKICIRASSCRTTRGI